MSYASVHFTDSNRFPDDEEFEFAIRSVEKAIESGIYPVRIGEGSSGAYLAMNCNHDIVGVFKPKNEEPYSALNPKWAKWLQRNVCPCCFGRGCLPLNQGYLSEVGASLVDNSLSLNIVPKTRVVRLAAPTFNYSKVDLAKLEAKEQIYQHCPHIGRYFNRLGLPFKLGSFQVFMEGYRNGTLWLECFGDRLAPPGLEKMFQLQFERMVVLDYIIRNTDRTHNNWLIKCSGIKATLNESEDINNFMDTETSLIIQLLPSAQTVKIAAIDNGLAFPFKHPDQWRAYPYHWADLRFAHVPFSSETIELVLPKISNIKFVNTMCEELRKLYEIDLAFNDTTFESQMAVLRGQCWNLSAALKERKTPAMLVASTPIRLLKNGKTKDGECNLTWSSYKRVTNSKEPLFRWC
ncbi:phosphatidylinositol 4 kinase type 2 beta [Trichuris trichiura]|uniref:Phosphatidylinositol 4-kinase type 2 n=1 Tax=Trichuris trichiura TaxID=36087 RepID=A0A077Z2C1_TRITR|nr:phosphatidylinositol 4 kinase type 2 beta [Trichuris trichiura]